MRRAFLPGEITTRVGWCERIEPLRKHPANPVLVADRPTGDGSASGIGIATFEPGRPAGQQFTGDGWFQTIPFRGPGGRLTLNANALDVMEVEVCSVGYGGPSAGFTRPRPVGGIRLSRGAPPEDGGGGAAAHAHHAPVRRRCA